MTYVYVALTIGRMLRPASDPTGFVLVTLYAAIGLAICGAAGCAKTERRSMEATARNAPASDLGTVDRAKTAPSAPPQEASARAAKLRGRGAASASAPWPPTTPPKLETEWCTSAVTALDEQTCYVLPDEPTQEVLIYLHGVVPPTPESPQKTNFQQVVASAARRAGVAALVPRGFKGMPGKFASWWNWPNGAAYSKHVDALVARFRHDRERLEALTGVRFTRVYMAGSSAGAYFATALALQGDSEAVAFGAMSGGGGAAHPRLKELSPKPFYIGYGSHDQVGRGARALGRVLEEAGWPVRVEKHPTGHGAREVYLDEAFEFWRKHTNSSARPRSAPVSP